MPARAVLEAPQVARLLADAGLIAGPASPLLAIAGAAPCAPGGPGSDRLAALGLLVTHGDLTRVNTAFRGVLEACAQPEEVLSLAVTGPHQPAFTLCRRGAFWSECTPGPLGVTKFEYPLARNAMVIAAVAALSSDHDEPAPLGFRFRGSAGDALVLSTIAAAGDSGITSDDLPGAVERLVAHSGRALAFAFAGATVAQTVGAVARLEAQSLLRWTGGRITASRAARAALATAATGGFTASRTVADHDGIRTQSLQVWRAGDRNLVVRRVRLDDGSPGVEWSDRDRASLRALVAALYQDESTLQQVLRG